MRIVLKALYKALMAILTIATMAFTLMPATDSEAAAIGRDANRFDLIQMRLAKAMMTVAPMGRAQLRLPCRWTVHAAPKRAVRCSRNQTKSTLPAAAGSSTPHSRRALW